MLGLPYYIPLWLYLEVVNVDDNYSLVTQTATSGAQPTGNV